MFELGLTECGKIQARKTVCGNAYWPNRRYGFEKNREAILFYETNIFWIRIYKKILDPQRWLSGKGKENGNIN